MKVVKFATDVTARVASVGRIAEVLTGMGSGDLRGRIDQPLTPELDRIRTDLNATIDTLRTAPGE